MQRMETTAVRRPEGKVDRGWRKQQIAQMMRHGPVPHLGVRHPDDEAMCVSQRASTRCPSTNDFVPPKTASCWVESELGLPQKVNDFLGFFRDSNSQLFGDYLVIFPIFLVS